MDGGRHRQRADATLRAAIVRGAVWAAVILAAGLLLWPGIGRGFSTGFQAAANLVFGAVTFGKGGHAQFLPGRRQPAVASAGDPASDRSQEAQESQDSWDTVVRLSIDGIAETNAIDINPRRLAFLPLLFFVAAVGAAPLRAKRKLICLSLGLPVLAMFSAGSVWLIVAWLFARIPGLVYDLSPAQQIALETGYEAFVTSIGNKYVVPVVIAGVLVVWQVTSQRRRQRQRSSRSGEASGERRGFVSRL